MVGTQLRNLSAVVVFMLGCAEPVALSGPNTTGGSSSGSGGRAAGLGGSPGSSPVNTASGGSNGAINPALSGGASARGGSSGALVSAGGYAVVQPSCTDRLKNGTETDVDCGGDCATKCAFGKACSTAADCTIDTCSNGKCTTCDNASKDGDETDVDCGGSCPRCAEGLSCSKVSDCATYNCDASTMLCGPTTNCLAVVPDTCACSTKVVNVSDAAGCQKVLDCFLANSCGPADACATGNDGVCGINTLGIDNGKLQAAKAVYACACAS